LANYRDFGTFYVMPTANERHVAGVGVPRSWRIATVEDPSRRHWCDEQGRIGQVQYGGTGHKKPPLKGWTLARQLVIRARSQPVAERVASLIRAGTLLSYPDLLEYPALSGIYSLGDLDARVIASETFAGQFHRYDNAHFGCHAAVEAWGNSSLIYALEKYRFSLERDWFTPHSADPIYRQRFPNRYEEETYHVKAAFAIVAAYSAIEELGLEPRSSEKRPRFVGPRKDQWNPEVLKDLQHRLSGSGISPSDTTFWIRRGGATSVERQMKPKLGVPAEWNRQHGVRDRVLSLADAVHYVSWLRNYVAAHRFRALTSAVSPYDVHNCQLVVRRLLLGRLGLWKKFIESSD
jgi:hypothetical protein